MGKVALVGVWVRMKRDPNRSPKKKKEQKKKDSKKEKEGRGKKGRGGRQLVVNHSLLRAKANFLSFVPILCTH